MLACWIEISSSKSIESERKEEAGRKGATQQRRLEHCIHVYTRTISDGIKFNMYSRNQV